MALSGHRRETNNNNVNRRFAGRELKFAVAAADDETKNRKKNYGTRYTSR
jgi:hypothetical protein